MAQLTLPQSLISAVQEQRAILFLGSGASHGAAHPNKLKIPLGNELRDSICDKFFGGDMKDRPLIAVASMAASEVGITHFQKYIREIFEGFGPADFHQLIPTFRWRAIATTNFDLIIERAYENSRGAVQKLVKSVKDGDLFDTRMNQESDPVGFLKLHGCIDFYTDEAIPLILGQEQYSSYALNRGRFYARLRDLAYEHPIIFCGYAIADPHIQQLLFDLSDKKVQRPPYFQVGPHFTDVEKRYWAANQVTCIQGSFAELLASLDKSISVPARKLRRDVSPDDLSIKTHYNTNGAVESDDLRYFLANDVVHLHGGLIAPRQDAKEFYRGYDTGFGCILQGLAIRRAIDDSILVDAVLVDEHSRRSGELFVLKGPAGSGKTVALKQIAWEAATAYDQLVLFSNGPASLRIEPVEEIYQLTGKRIFLFVDHLALSREPLAALLTSSRARKIPLTVIGAERDNEWNIYCDNLEPFVSQQFPVGNLEVDEASALLVALEQHDALGLLGEKTKAERLEAFMTRAERQLLVALHETTLGIPFEQIVLDEYNRVRPREAQGLYLDICALHQFGAPVRAGLVSRATGVKFKDFGARFLKPLEEVVFVEAESDRGDAHYKSRHQHVAELVFNQVASTGEEKYDLLAHLIQAMNIDYSSDRETFGRLVRGRSMAAMFTAVELGRLLYEKAEEAAPNEYFIPHQRAVFEISHQGGSLAEAERAAERAGTLNPKSQGVRHTQAEVARRQALNAVDPLLKQSYRRIARERLTRDTGRLSEYDLNTRARVAIDELKDLLGKVGKDDSANPALLAAVKDAETAIQHGRADYPESPEILATEASLRDLLDQAPQALAALERAFKLNVRQDWLAVRLSRRYADKGDLKRASEVIQKCLGENPGSKLAHLELAQLMMKEASNKDRILEHLKLSFTAGDNNFEAQFWYARELFLHGKFSDAATVFDSLSDRAPGKFRPSAAALVSDGNGSASSYSGTVTRKEEGYAFVRLTDFAGDIFASKADSLRGEWDRLRSGTKIEAFLGFSRRGARIVKMTSKRTLGVSAA